MSDSANPTRVAVSSMKAATCGGNFTVTRMVDMPEGYHAQLPSGWRKLACCAYGGFATFNHWSHPSRSAIPTQDRCPRTRRPSTPAAFTASENARWESFGMSFPRLHSTQAA